MTIITDAAAADSLLEKYVVRAPLTIIVIAKAEDRFSPDTVKSLLDTGAEIITAPKGVSIPFVFGLAAGKADRPGDVYILSSDPDVKKTVALMGYKTELQKRTAKENGKKASRPTAAKQTKVKEPAAEKKESKTAITAGETETPKEPTKRKTRTKAVEVIKDSPVPKKKPVPKKIYGVSDNDGEKPSAEFVKALTKAGVDKQDSKGVWQAVSKSTASIVYDMQLRLCLLDADKAKDIYDKTKDIFNMLKEMTN